MGNNESVQVHSVGFSAVNLVIKMTVLIPLNDKRAAQLQDEQTLPSQLDVSLLLMNLFFHPFIFVMSLVFPVREMKGSPSSVKGTNHIRRTHHTVILNTSQHQLNICRYIYKQLLSAVTSLWRTLKQCFCHNDLLCKHDNTRKHEEINQHTARRRDASLLW